MEWTFLLRAKKETNFGGGLGLGLSCLSLRPALIFFFFFNEQEGGLEALHTYIHKSIAHIHTPHIYKKYLEWMTHPKEQGRGLMA